MKLSRLLILSLLLFFNNAIAQISKEDVKQVFFDANSGNHKAQNYLGSMYATGNGVNKDYKQAAAWYLKAADQGNLDATNRLAYIYKEGKGVSKDYIKAKALFEKVITNSSNTTHIQRAQMSIGIMYYYGEGVAQDYTKAIEWFKKPADKKNKKAIRWLYSAKRAIDKNKPINEISAKAELGDMYAQYQLAQYYSSTDIDTQDFQAAFKWFKRAADQGEAESTLSIGYMFYTGQGVPKNYQTAREWFLKAKKLGHKKANAFLNVIEKESNPNRHQPITTFDAIINLSILALIALYIIAVGWGGAFRKSSIFISPVSLYLFVVYYEDWIQSTCSGECNIRIDIFITYPLLFGVVIVGLINLVKIDKTN